MGRMMQARSCERRGSTLVFHDEDGIRHVVRASSIIAASDADATQDATILQLPGSRSLMVRVCLDEVAQWMAATPPAPATQARAVGIDPDMLRTRLLVSNLRLLWLRTMAALIEEGTLPKQVFADMRESCLEAARAFGQTGGPDHRLVGAKGVEDLADLFSHLLPGDGKRLDS
jgi:hypothetical protein